MKIVIEPLSSIYLEQVVAIEVVSQASPWSREMFVREMENKCAFFFVCLIDGVVVGYAGFRDMAGEAEIFNIVVAPEWRGKGLGRMILEYLLKQVDQYSIADIFLEVRRSNHAAISLYKKSGFVECGLRKKYYPDGEDALLFCKKNSELAQ